MATFVDHDAEQWRLARLGLLFLLDIFQITRGDRDDLDMLILSVIATANVAPVTLNPELEQRYANATPPDDLRRPITVNAVAASLGLPFETVRRRIHGLAAAGDVEMTPRGVLQPAAVGELPYYIERAEMRCSRVRRLYEDLRQVGAFGPEPQWTRVAGIAGPPVRTVNRVMADYSLRMVESVLGAAGGALPGLMLLETARFSGAHIDPLTAEMDPLLSAEAQKPVRLTTVARRLSLPVETVRRHMTKLAETGLLVRGPKGFIVTAKGMVASAQVGTSAGLGHLRRMFDRLDELGILAWWDEDDQAAREQPASRA